MNNLKRYAYIIFLIWLVQFYSSSKICAQTETSAEILDMGKKVFQLVNQYRIFKNLSQLTLDEIITRQARRHSRALANKRVLFGHYGFDLRVDMISVFIPISVAAENVGYHRGCSDCAERVLSYWLDSIGHRNSIEGDYRITGVGIVKDPNAKGYYFTQIFCK